eukprot:gnl/Chilomastix_cuspidata/3080.p1 GENE.gnl/Chilomastix_cuspidata/3080~~gnl/Chilomastix_cuspidata/3080.p1  ORF type:complete len:382 (-),score=102.76 gnl/Chilomastix_cuspidata/3080:64-1209(-)
MEPSVSIEPGNIEQPPPVKPVELSRCAACAGKSSRFLFSFCSNIADPIVVFICIVVILAMSFSMLYLFVYRTLGDHLLLQIIFGLLTVYIIVMIIYNYTVTLLRGRIQRGDGRSNLLTGLPPLPWDAAAAGAPVPDTVRACQKCRRLRPLRTHHCRKCDVCYAKYDHHCPWIAGCIAIHNYAHFWLFVVWGFAGSLYGSVAIAVGAVAELMRGADALGPLDRTLFVVSVCSLVAGLVMGLSSGTLFRFHIDLLRTNQTTAEHFINMAEEEARVARGGEPGFVNVFDMGDVSRNIEQVFGRRFLLKLFVPTRITSPVGIFHWENLRTRAVVNVPQILNQLRSPEESRDSSRTSRYVDVLSTSTPEPVSAGSEHSTISENSAQ